MLGLVFSSKLDWGCYIISTAKKIGALIRSMKFLFPEVALYLSKSTIHPCMEYCCQVWAGAPSYFLELLNKLQKRICRTVGPSLAASFEPLAHCQNVASLSLFIGITLEDVLQNWLNLFQFLFLKGGLVAILIDCRISVTIPRCYKDVYVNSLDSGILYLQNPHTVRLQNSLPII